MKYFLILSFFMVMDACALDYDELLFEAASRCDSKKVNILLEKGSDPNKFSKRSLTTEKTPLMKILMNQNINSKECISAMELLLNNGANPNIQNKNGENAKFLLAQHQRFTSEGLQVFNKLLNKGGDLTVISSMDKKNLTFLMFLVDGEFSNKTRLLSSNKYAVDKYKHFLSGFKSVVSSFVSSGGNINAQDSNGQTALIRSVISSSGKCPLAIVLLEH